ncbi:MAG: esterase-like activity of phytase family protein, partial [Xanthobacteraceae bacterium]
LAGLIALAAGPSAPLAQSRSRAPEPIKITATAIDRFSRNEPDQRRFGALEFRGGLVLASETERFGGLSGLSIEPDGQKFLALSDRGNWVRGRILVNGDRPTGIADAELAPVLGANGRPLASSGWYDTEALAHDGGTLYVGIERVQRLVRLDYGSDGLAARARTLATPAGIRELPSNQGIESLAFVPKPLPLGGTLIALSERGLDANGNIRGFLIGGPSPGTFSVKRSNDFDVTDAALTPDGNLLILERHFSFLRGVGMRIRRVPLSDVKPGAVLEGTVLIEAGNAHQIDNMEALAAHRNAAGETILTILSDDNLSRLQRTLLLRFAIVGD